MSPTPGALTEQAQRFAGVLAEILNGTVATGVQVTAVIDDDHRRAYLGVGASDAAPLAAEPIPLTTDPEPAEVRTWLLLAFACRMDHQERFLSVHRSKLGLCINPDTKRCFIRVEFERDKREYPKAHIQITGSSEELGYAWAVAGQAPRQLQDVHIPVGGIRYRPSLEDFIEFLATEGLVADLHDGWRQVIEAHRPAYRRRQLRAAIRRDPASAVRGLQQLGYTVAPPD